MVFASISFNNNKVRAEVACRLDSLCVALGEQWSVVTMEILPALVVDADLDVRCEVSARTRTCSWFGERR